MEYQDHLSQRAPADLSKFWVITIISNPVRYQRRYKLYFDFVEMCEAAGVKLVTVEMAFGHRKFMVTDHRNPYHLQLKSVEELWHKENMVNLGVKHACRLALSLGSEVREVAWVDADCRSAMLPRHWFEETWHQLQVYEFVQMWEYLIDLDYNYNPIGERQPGFMANYIKYGSPNPSEFEELKKKNTYKHTLFGRPGLAWAANLDAFNKVGGLIEISILGAGDWYMAHGLLGLMNLTLKGWEQLKNYQALMLHWQELAERWIKRDVGYVKGTVYHDFHGRKINRGYGTRGQILIRNKYDPITDVKRDSQGLLQLETYEPRQIKMRDQIRAYFRARNEDSIE